MDTTSCTDRVERWTEIRASQYDFKMKERKKSLIIIGSTALGVPCPSPANVASALYPGHPPTNFYIPVSLPLPLPRHSILISVGRVLVDLQDLSTISS